MIKKCGWFLWRKRLLRLTEKPSITYYDPVKNEFKVRPVVSKELNPAQQGSLLKEGLQEQVRHCNAQPDVVLQAVRSHRNGRVDRNYQRNHQKEILIHFFLKNKSILATPFSSSLLFPLFFKLFTVSATRGGDTAFFSLGVLARRPSFLFLSIYYRYS